MALHYEYRVITFIVIEKKIGKCSTITEQLQGSRYRFGGFLYIKLDFPPLLSKSIHTQIKQHKLIPHVAKKL